MASQPWFPFYWGDYVQDTASLSLTEHGAYLKLLGALYTEQRSLPADWPALFRSCGAHDEVERQAVVTVVDRYWVKTLDGIEQPRAMVEIEKRRHIAERNTRIARDRYQSGTSAAPDHHQNRTSTSTSISTSRDTVTATRAYALPPWLDVQAWTEWEVYRRERRKTLTPSTARKQIKFLEQNQADHVAIINKAIEKGWQGLFPLQEDHGGKAGTGGDTKVVAGVSARDRVGRATASRSGANRQRREGGDT